jgi:hypothetical protein
VTRIVLTGGSVFDGTGGSPFEADVPVEGGRIAELGRGIDGDEAVDVSGRSLLPGLFDCHVHVILSHIDFFRLLQTPLSLRFFEAARNLSFCYRPARTAELMGLGGELGTLEPESVRILSSWTAIRSTSLPSASGSRPSTRMARGSAAPSPLA